MRTRHIGALLIGVGVMLWAGCNPAPTPGPTSTVEPTSTMDPTQTITPTLTVTPSLTPTPSATPGPDLAELLQAPQADYANAELDAAREGYEAIQQIYPDEAAPWLGLAEVASRQGQPDEALDYLRAALEVDPYNPEALNALAVALEALDVPAAYDQLVEVYGALLVVEPDNAGVREARAVIQARQGDAEGAVETLSDGGTRSAWERAAQAAYSQRCYAGAATIASAGFDVYDDDPALVLTSALAYLAADDMERGLTELDRLLLVDEANVAGWYWRGRTLARYGAAGRAMADLDTAIEIGTRSGLIETPLALAAINEKAALIARDDVESAFSYVAGLVFEYGSQDALLLAYTRIDWARDSRDLALGRLDVLVRDGYAPALYQRALYLLEEDEVDAALADLTAYVEAEPFGPVAEEARRLIARYE